MANEIKLSQDERDLLRLLPKNLVYSLEEPLIDTWLKRANVELNWPLYKVLQVWYDLRKKHSIAYMASK